MEKKEFVRAFSKYFQQRGFFRRGKQHYRDFSNDWMVVFALDKSTWDDAAYYIESGFIIKPVNPQMPFPAFNFADIRLPSVEDESGDDHIHYEKFTEETLRQMLAPHVDKALRCGNEGTQSIIDNYIKTNDYGYIRNYADVEYLGIDREGLSVIGF